MKSAERRENLLEAILMAREIGDTTISGIQKANSEDVQIQIDTGELVTLAAEGFVEQHGEVLSLTEKGLRIAEKTVRRHRLAEMLLFSLLGVDRNMASEIACKVEHGIREEMLSGVCTLLGHPSTCPHGKSIPKGDCCRKHQNVVCTQVVPLSSLKPGERGRIVYIKPRFHGRLHRLSAMGLNPGVEVELHQRKPAFCLRYEQTELAIDQGVADDIQVSKLN